MQRWNPSLYPNVMLHCKKCRHASNATQNVYYVIIGECVSLECKGMWFSIILADLCPSDVVLVQRGTCVIQCLSSDQISVFNEVSAVAYRIHDDREKRERALPYHALNVCGMSVIAVNLLGDALTH